MFMNTPVFTLFFIMSSVFLSKNHLPLDRPTYHFPGSLALLKLKLAQAVTLDEHLRNLKGQMPESPLLSWGRHS